MQPFSSLGISLVLTVLVITSGCASITSGKNQPVSVTTTCDGDDLQGATCTLRNDNGSWFVKTPGTVGIFKAYGDMTIDCKKGSLAKGANTFQSKSEGAVWGNLVAGGLIGYAVDASTGAGFSYPPVMTVNLTGDCKQAIQSK